MLKNISFLLIYFIHNSLYVLISYPKLPFHFPSGSHSLFSVSINLFLSYTYIHFYFVDSMYKGCQVVFFCLTYFPKHDILLVHPRCCKWQNFILFYGWVIFYCIYCFHLSVDKHRGCFHNLAIVNSAATNMACMHLFELVFLFFSSYILSTGIVGLDGSFVFGFFLRDLHTVFCSDCINLHSHQQYIGSPLLHLLFVDFLMINTLTGVMGLSYCCDLHFANR